MSEGFHHPIQNGKQFKTYELFVSEIFHAIISGHGWSWVTKTTESEPADKGDYI